VGAELVADNIRQLGFQLRDIRFLLISHEHRDHVGGIARLQQLTGATLVATEPAAKVLNSGVPSPDDPQAGMHKPFPAANVGRVIADGGDVRLGNIRLFAMTTPGHTPGALSWRWESCDGGVCRTMVYADSLSPVSRDDYKFSDHPDNVAAYRASIAKIAETRCEILLTPHPSASQMRDRMTGKLPLFDPEGCKNYAAARSKSLDERLGPLGGLAQADGSSAWCVFIGATSGTVLALLPPDSARVEHEGEIAVVDPIPNASVRIAVNVKPLFFNNVRNAKLMFCFKAFISVFKSALSA